MHLRSAELLRGPRTEVASCDRWRFGYAERRMTAGEGWRRRLSRALDRDTLKRRSLPFGRAAELLRQDPGQARPGPPVRVAPPPHLPPSPG